MKILMLSKLQGCLLGSTLEHKEKDFLNESEISKYCEILVNSDCQVIKSRISRMACRTRSHRLMEDFSIYYEWARMKGIYQIERILEVSVSFRD